MANPDDPRSAQEQGPTLRPGNSAPPSPASGRPTITDKESGTAAVRAAANAYTQYLIDNPDAKVVGGQVVINKTTREGGVALTSKDVGTFSGQTNPDTGQPYKAGDVIGGTSKTTNVVDPVGTHLLRMSDAAAADLKAFISDNGVGAGRSYLSTETDKTQEATRQFKDFLDRAKGTYDLAADEQKFNQAADDQNIANAKAVHSGDLSAGMTGWYTPRTLSNSYSPTLAATVPSSVRPDYQLNGAVGLPGNEGFQVPGFAQGTDATVDPELRGQLGTPMIVEVPPLDPSTARPWPWGRQGVAQ